MNPKTTGSASADSTAAAAGSAAPVSRRAGGAYGVIRASEMSQLEALRLTHASTPGLTRECALAALKEIGADPAFMAAFGSGRAALDGNGGVVNLRAASKLTKEDNDAAHAGGDDGSQFIDYDPRLRNSVPAGSVGLNKMIGDMPVFNGPVILVAHSGVGKTPFAHAMASAGVDEYAIVRVGEPFAGYGNNQAVAAEGLASAALKYRDVVIDSIKDLIGDGGGNTATGGVSRRAIAQLSHWSDLGNTLGTTFYIPLNPSSGDKKTMDVLLSAARSSATTVISFVDGTTWRYSARPGEGLPRIEMDVEFRSDGTIRVSNVTGAIGLPLAQQPAGVESVGRDIRAVSGRTLAGLASLARISV